MTDATSNFPGLDVDSDIHNVPTEFKKEGSDWSAIFNPEVTRVLDVELVHTLMHESVVCCVKFSPDGKYLATGCNHTAQIYDTQTGQRICVLDNSAGRRGDLYIRSVCFSPDGKYLATGGEDAQIRVWDIATQHVHEVFNGHRKEVYSIDFSPDGQFIVSGSDDETVRIWNMTDGTSRVLTIDNENSPNGRPCITSISISPNGQFAAAGCLDSVVRIWDLATFQLVETLKGHTDSIYSVSFTPDGKGLVSGSLDKTSKYWDVSYLAEGTSTGGQCTMNFTGHKDYVLTVSLSNDGRWVVSGSKDRSVQFRDLASGIVQFMLQGHKNSVISIDLSRGESTLATGGGDWQARIWKYSTI